MRKLLLLSSCALALVLAGCSEAPQTAAKKEEKPPEAVTGQTALFRMYQQARSWAPDAQVLKMNSMPLAEVPADPGKSGAWQATFTSQSQSSARTYTWSAIEGEGNLHKGVFPGQQEGWSGSADRSYMIGDVKVDTDAAYETSLKKLTDAEKKNPAKTITFLLEKPAREKNPVWRVVWGESVGTANLSVLVNATSGEYQKTLH